jgi:hypothetical protein
MSSVINIIINRRRRVDLIILIFWPIIAAAISFSIGASTFSSIILFLGVPAAYLSYLNPKKILKLFLFSFVLGVPLAIVIDYVMQRTGGWFLPSSIFGPFRLLGYVTIEQIIWLFLYIYLVAIFYETFIEKNQVEKTYYHNFKYLITLMVLIYGLFGFFYFLAPAFLLINYFYLKLGLVLGLLPITLVLLKSPKLCQKFFQTAIYFFFLSLIYELTALTLGQWTFPAKNQFIGFVEIFGLRFPFEEFFFWIMLGAMAVLAYYEFFDDDLK